MDSYNRKTDEELLRRMHNGDKKVIDYLMVKYKNLVRKKAKALFLIGADNDDLIQEGMIGLFKAIRDPFITLRKFVSAGRCIPRWRLHSGKSMRL